MDLEYYINDSKTMGFRAVVVIFLNKKLLLGFSLSDNLRAYVPFEPLHYYGKYPVHKLNLDREGRHTHLVGHKDGTLNLTSYIVYGDTGIFMMFFCEKSPVLVFDICVGDYRHFQYNPVKGFHNQLTGTDLWNITEILRVNLHK